jgi:hypothetical protein
MFKKSALVLAFLSLAACSTSQPRVIQASTGNPDLVVTVGMATQIEMPEDSRISSVVVGNKDLVLAEPTGDVVTVSGKGAEGTTNMIIRARTESGRMEVYQYRVTVRKD